LVALLPQTPTRSEAFSVANTPASWVSRSPYNIMWPPRILSLALLIRLTTGQAIKTVSSVPDGAPVVDLGYASYLGYVNSTSNITYYRGIQYAQAPTGALRWQKPHPIESNNDFGSGVLNATTIAPQCYGSLPGAYAASGVGMVQVPITERS
jgi:hypothetical protein